MSTLPKKNKHYFRVSSFSKDNSDILNENYNKFLKEHHIK